MKKFFLFAAAALVAASASAATENVLVEMYPGSAQLNGWGVDGLLTQSENEVKITNPSEAENPWGVQIAYDMDFTEGTTYYITFDVKGDAGVITSGFQEKGTYAGCGNFTDFEITSDWNTVTIEGTAGAADGVAANRWVANLGKYAGTFYIAKLKIYTLEEGGDEPVSPGDDKNILATFYDGNGGTLGGWGADFSQVEEDGKPCIQVTNDSEKENDWNSQMAMDYDFEPGVTYYIDMEVKGTVDGTISSGLQNSTTYAGGGNFTPFNITKEWNKQTIECTATEAGDGLPNRWTANFGKYVGTAWITNVVLYTLDPSAVETVAPVQVKMTGVYNLQGVKVADEMNSDLPKGIYIVNGKKVVR